MRTLRRRRGVGSERRVGHARDEPVGRGIGEGEDDVETLENADHPVLEILVELVREEKERKQVEGDGNGNGEEGEGEE